MRLPLLCAVLAAFFACSSKSAPAIPPPAPAPSPAPAAKAWTAYFGNLHAHSEVSDGVETPAVAFEYAKTDGKLHFLCLSEHNHEVTKAELDQVRAAATASTTSGFIGIQGQEYSKLPPGGNHVNVYDVGEPILDDVSNDYRRLYREWLPAYKAANPTAIVFCQFNHPDSVNRDYGIAKIGGKDNYNGDWASFVGDADPWVSLIAIISGPADSNTPKTETPPKDAHRDTESGFIRAWQTYLDKGFHLSPVADQDNHRKSWGTRTTARTGVWLSGTLNRDNLLNALKAGQTFATEDKNLSVWFSMEDQPMGSRLADRAGEFVLQVRIEDTDEPSSEYTIKVYRDIIGDGNLPLEVASADNIAVGTVWRHEITHEVGKHECYFIHVDQESSPDDAWTAPIWIDPALAPEAPGHTDVPAVGEGVKYVGSKNSEVYHFPNCKVALTIKTENKVEYTTEPDGKRLHKNCPQE